MDAIITQPVATQRAEFWTVDNYKVLGNQIEAEYMKMGRISSSPGWREDEWFIVVFRIEKSDGGSWSRYGYSPFIRPRSNTWNMSGIYFTRLRNV